MFSKAVVNDEEAGRQLSYALLHFLLLSFQDFSCQFVGPVFTHLSLESAVSPWNFNEVIF